MSKSLVLGIDCGGTHTDAALLSIDGEKAALVAAVKTATLHDNLPKCVCQAMELIKARCGGSLGDIERVTLGTTLEINALVQGKADKAGLALSAGSGLDPRHFVLGDYVVIVPGGLDHRGVETEKLHAKELAEAARQWQREGVEAVACVGKFSPRNPAHENEMAKVIGDVCDLPVTTGHSLSGRLNFPRRIATAYYNASVARINAEFLDAVESALAKEAISGSFSLLKADGGAIPFAHSRREPIQSVLSGPAASVMGVLALWPEAGQGCSLLLDMGGTTTDIALLLNGSPVVDNEGMGILGRRTLVRSLASVSIGIGGDSLIALENANLENLKVGPGRVGPAMAFGGENATLLDALNCLDGENSGIDRGDVAASVAGMKKLAQKAGFPEDNYMDIASRAVELAIEAVKKVANELVDSVNSRPIYTLAGLKAAKEARPALACLVGGPAACARERLASALGIKTLVAPHADVANAIGAALTRPTASLEIYADTGKGVLSAPALNFQERIPASYTLEKAKERGLELLKLMLAADGAQDANVEVVEADLFATLDDYGRGAKDMRVSCQATPGIVASIL